MKKIITLAVIALATFFGGCSSKSVQPTTTVATVETQKEIPVEIQKLVTANQFDTVLTISTSDKVYAYDYHTKKCLNVLDKPNDDNPMVYFIIFIVVIIFLVMLFS